MPSVSWYCCKRSIGALVSRVARDCARRHRIRPARARGSRRTFSTQSPHRAARRSMIDRSIERAPRGESTVSRTDSLHVAAVLAADFVQRARDLAERAHLHGLDQLREHVAAGRRDRLQPPQRLGASAALRAWNACTASTCACFSSSRRADQRATPCSLSPRSLRNVFTPMIGSEPSCFASRSTGSLPGSCRAGTSSPSRRARRRARRAPRTPCRRLPRRGRSAPRWKYEPCHGFWFMFRPSSRLMISWIATARRTLSSVGVVSASS